MKLLPILLAGVISATSAWATSFIPRPFPSTVKEASAIVRGTVRDKKVDWSEGEDGTRRIYTFYPIEIKEVFKGDGIGSTLQMRQMGGEKDGVGLQVAGTAQFSPGEDAVVMLGPVNRDGSRDVWGLMMGKYGVERGENGEEYLSGPGLEGGENDPGAIIDGESLENKPAARRWSLSALRKLVVAQGGRPQVAAPSASAPPSPVAPIRDSSTASSANPTFQAPRCGVNEPETCASPAPTPEATEAKRPNPLLAGVLLLIGGGALYWARRRLRKSAK